MFNKNPYNAVAEGTIADVQMVVINGTPIYGDVDMLHQLNVKTEPLTVCGSARALNADALPAGPFAQIQARLSAKMKAIGAELAPLTECVK